MFSITWRQWSVKKVKHALAGKKRLSLDVVLMAVAALPVRVVERTVYQASVREAERRIVHRDPDDVELLALALHAKIPVWSNDDNDFESVGVEWFTTAELLARLGE